MLGQFKIEHNLDAQSNLNLFPLKCCRLGVRVNSVKT